MKYAFFLAFSACASAPRSEPAPIVLPASPTVAPTACEAGNQIVCAETASTLVSSDKNKARELAESSCSANVMRGCNVLALLSEEGGDEARAIELYTRACNGNEWRGCSNLGRLRIAKNDVQAGIDFHEKACRLGGTPSCLSAGSRLAPGQPAPDPKRAAEMFRLGCDGGDLDCCNGLGTSYARGEGVPRDDARAIELFTRACDGNVGIGCKGLGDMFAPTDPNKSRGYYERACTLGYQRGCERIGKSP